jgi:hypothetical protein
MVFSDLLEKSHMSVPLVNIVKIPTQKKKVKKFLGFNESTRLLLRMLL